MKKILIWGAGKKGKTLIKRLNNRNIVKYIIDNDNNKIGKLLEGIEIKGPNYLIKGNGKNCLLINTIDDESVCQILNMWAGQWITYQDFLESIEMKCSLDDTLYYDYCYNNTISNVLYTEVIENWYRKDFCNDDNKKLVWAMKNHDKRQACEIFDSIYTQREILFDECYTSRPGMHLARTIINDGAKKYKILDMACGHGELIQKLKEDGHHVYGCDYSVDRVSYLQAKGIDASVQDVENTNYSDNKFDVVICMECLEHVANVKNAVVEIWRVLRQGGVVIVTVPYLKNCDCVTHVRQFDEVKLASLFDDRFEICNMLKIPYLYWMDENNLFLVARKSYVQT